MKRITLSALFVFIAVGLLVVGVMFEVIGAVSQFEFLMLALASYFLSEIVE